MRLLALMVLAASSLATPLQAAEPAPSDTLVAFSMPDQHDRLHGDAELRGRVALVMWVDRKGNDHRRRWARILERKLRSELAQDAVRMQIVAHADGVPGFIKGRVKQSFRDEVDAPVFMDWDGVFAHAYQPRQDSVNLLVFDAEGRLVHRAAAPGLDQAVLDGVLAAVQAAVASGPPGRPSAVRGGP